MSVVSIISIIFVSEFYTYSDENIYVNKSGWRGQCLSPLFLSGANVYCIN
jgi:hypothetical protein